MTEKLHKPYEEVMSGYYDCGENYYIIADNRIEFPHYVAIHERTHINLGTSTTVGLFHQFIHYLCHQKKDYISRPSFIDKIFNRVLAESRVVHEAAATYHEMSQVEHYKDIDLKSYYEKVPNEYRRYDKIFRDVFKDSIPPWPRGQLCYHISRLAMSNYVLDEYLFPTNTKLNSFDEYFSKQEVSPISRLVIILKHIKPNNVNRLFGNFLKCYEDHNTELHNSYKTRSFENRKISYKIQHFLHEAVYDDFNKMKNLNPIFADVDNLKETKVPTTNKLITNWKKYFIDNNYTNDIKMTFTDIDEGAEFDILDGRQTIIPARKPQSNLQQLVDIKIIPPGSQCVIRAWMYEGDSPFLLSENPTRYLSKGDVYLRFFCDDLPYILFYITSDKNELYNLLHRSNSFVIFECKDYEKISNLLSSKSKTNSQISFIWNNVADFRKHGAINNEISYAIIPINGRKTIIIFIKDDYDLYHLLLVLDGSIWSTLEEITKDLDKVFFLNESGSEFFISTIVNQFEHII